MYLNKLVVIRRKLIRQIFSRLDGFVMSLKAGYQGIGKMQTDCRQSLRIGKIRAFNGSAGILFGAATQHNHKNSDIKSKR